MAGNLSKPSSGALLLLPSPRLPLTRPALKTACGPALASTLSALKTEDGSPKRLDIGVRLPASFASQKFSRTRVFPQVQNVLENIYSLFCVIAVQEGIDLDFPGGVDARIFLTEEVPNRPSSHVSMESLVNRNTSGPLIDFPTLISSGRHYVTIFAVESEEGEEVLRTFLGFYDKKNKVRPTIRRVRGGTSMTRGEEATDEPDNSHGVEGDERIHMSVAVGGTFDHLHIGHKLLLSAAVFLADPGQSDENRQSSRRITIGITGDELLTKKKFADQMENWEQRQEKIADFLESILIFSAETKKLRHIERVSNPSPNGRYVRVRFGLRLIIDYVQISDPYGPTITDENISALVISKETRAGGQAVNDKRKERGWTGLDVFEVDVLDAGAEKDDQAAKTSPENFESKISSTEIRRRLSEKARSELH